MSKNIAFIVLFWFIPFSFSKTIEFGLKLKAYGGYQDDLVFGLINLQSYHDSIKLRELVEGCLNDYLTSEIRTGVIDHKKLEGIVGKVKLADNKGDQMKIGFTGDVYYFHCYLMTMIPTYYLGLSVRIHFYGLPTVKTFRKRPAKLGEILLFDVETSFTDFDTDPLYSKRGESMDSSEASEIDEEVKEPFLQNSKSLIDEEDFKEINNHKCKCCNIS